MIKHLPEQQSEAQSASGAARRSSRRLSLLLWTLWTLLVIATAYFSWHADTIARRPLNLIGLMVHSSVAGVIGLVVLTIVEIRLQPWRFLN